MLAPIACAMIRRSGSGPHAGDLRGLADLLEPDSSRACASPDIAFADTIHVRDLDDELAPPPSGPVIVNDPDQGTQWMTPFAFPLPAASEDVSLPTRLRVLAARIRHGVRGSLEELRELWSHTTDLVDPRESRALTIARRVRALWSFWEWERGDIARAGAIGLAVFAFAAVLGAVALDRTDSGLAATAASPHEGRGPEATGNGATGPVRQPRTVEQHTPRVHAARVKAVR